MVALSQLAPLWVICFLKHGRLTVDFPVHRPRLSQRGKTPLLTDSAKSAGDNSPEHNPKTRARGPKICPTYMATISVDVCCPHSSHKTSKVSKNNISRPKILGGFMAMKWITLTSWLMLSGFGTSSENSHTNLTCLAQLLACMNDVVSSNCRHAEQRPPLV